jgi:hypothetical protein
MMTKESMTVMFTLSDALSEDQKVQLRASVQETMDSFFLKKKTHDLQINVLKVDVLRRYGTGV